MTECTPWPQWQCGTGGHLPKLACCSEASAKSGDRMWKDLQEEWVTLMVAPLKEAQADD